MTLAALVATLAARGETVATCESLTAGMLAARIADVPGASAVLRGGLVTYATDLKVSLAGLEQALVDGGVVTEAVAQAMAEGARRSCGADWALATTGVAGPGPADGVPAGTAWVALAGPRPATRVVRMGDIGRAKVREGVVEAALALLAEVTDR